MNAVIEEAENDLREYGVCDVSALLCEIERLEGELAAMTECAKNIDSARVKYQLSRIPEEWISDPDTIPQEVIIAARDAICREFGNNGTDGYYKRIIRKIMKAVIKSC